MERLLTPSLVLELAMRYCIYGKDNASFPSGPRSLWLPSLTKDLQAELKKGSWL